MPLQQPQDAAPAWSRLSDELRGRVGESAFEIWLAPLQPTAFTGELLTLTAPPETAGWLTGRYGPVIAAAAAAALGDGTRVVIDGHAATGTGGPQQALPDPRAAAPHRPAAEKPAERSLNPRYRFEQFIIGRGNHLAHAAALAVAENPGQAYNPLFLYAPPGMGKTHLLHAIGNYVSDYSPGAVIRLATAESFTNHFIAALNARGLEEFKRAYRDADVLLLDDVQFLASKAKTEEEFFHTFNALYDNGRQLVLTCDRLPRALTAIEQRLRERFEAGLVAEITPPDHATRVAILYKRAALDGIEIADPEVLEMIADRVTDNIRALEGALIRVVAFHSLTRRPIDPALTAEVLDAMYPVTPDRRPGSRTPGHRRSAHATQPRAAADDRRDPDDGRRPVRTHRRPTRLLQPGGQGQLAPPVGDPARPRSHRRLAAGDRTRVRRPQSRHGSACLQARLGTVENRSTGC